jgi:hypothetical protein
MFKTQDQLELHKPCVAAESHLGSSGNYGQGSTVTVWSYYRNQGQVVGGACAD